MKKTKKILGKQSRQNPAPEPAAGHSFPGAESFLQLMLKLEGRSGQVVIRTYNEGSWVQFSGKDFVHHIGLAHERWKPYWNKHLPVGGCLLLVVRNSYSGLVAALAAVLTGRHVMLAPTQMGLSDLKWCAEHFQAHMVGTDSSELEQELGGLGLPLLNFDEVSWPPQCQAPLLENLEHFRQSRLGTGAPALASSPTPIGRFRFVSFGHDGFQKPEELCLDALVQTASQAVLSLGVPAGIQWRTMDLLSPSNPFAHVGRFGALLKNGMLGFPNLSSDWEDNMRILRPTVLFASPDVLSRLCGHIAMVFHRQSLDPRVFVGKRIEALEQFLKSGRALKLPESLFTSAKRGLRLASRFSMGRSLIKEAVEDLRFVVHGLAPAPEACVQTLERLGIPVIETYGTTAAAGMLSTNTFQEPFFNLIGTPLPHVAFRLGANSMLEYKLSLEVFEGHGQWMETGDVAQMTPYGFVITGRKRHLFTTAHGVVVSPVRLEQALREHPLIADACVVGERLPFLSALIVLHGEVLENFATQPQTVKEQVEEAVAKVNEALPRNATIKKFQILTKPFSEADGERLPSGSINRLKILATRAQDIHKIYGEIEE